MGLNKVFAAVLGATLVAWSGMSIADEYRPGEFFGLDLAKAVLSPKPLGPANQFAPVQIEARADRVAPVAPSRAERATPAKTAVAHARADKPHGGCLIDVPTGAFVAQGLSMPHSRSSLPACLFSRRARARSIST